MSTSSHYERTYLGDGVYAHFDGYQIALTVDYGYGPGEVIYLEPDVFQALVAYQESISNQSSK